MTTDQITTTKVHADSLAVVTLPEGATYKGYRVTDIIDYEDRNPGRPRYSVYYFTGKRRMTKGLRDLADIKVPA